MPLPLPLLAAAAAAAWALLAERKDRDERARTIAPPPIQLQPLMPGAENYLPYFVKFAGTVPQTVINAAANVLHAKNPLAAATLIKNLDAIGYPTIASMIRTAAATWPAAAAGASLRELAVRKARCALVTAAGETAYPAIGQRRIVGQQRRLVRQC